MSHLKDHIGYWINRLRMQVHQSFEERLDRHDLSVAQWCILLALYQEDANSITSLAKYIEVDKASISRVLDKLVMKGLVDHGEGKDRRSGFISLTKEGRGLVPRLIQEAEENERHYSKALSKKEVELLRELFIKIFKTSIPSITLDGWLTLGAHHVKNKRNS